MGNFLGGLTKRERRSVKIKKVDGTVMNLPSPVYVKEIVCDNPNHGVFEAGSVRRPVDYSRPLPHSSELRPGSLYLLIPFALSPVSADSGLASENEGLSKEKMVNKLKARIVSACKNGSGMRLTIRLSKKEAVSLLGNDGQEVMKKLVASFSLSTMEKHQQKISEWKPSLEPIAENFGSVLHRSTSAEI
ncbi:hypothetical protein SUGI_1074530 [Cryptomeria japonica]|nr:hypothetical protein SUGI_1074530 [Cryptomeria japonica]